MAFLQAYRDEPVLWDPNHVDHKDRDKVSAAWHLVSAICEFPVKELKRKKEALMATFRSQFRKKKASVDSSVAGEGIHHPIWFAYDFMESFLKPTYALKRPLEPDHVSDQLESFRMLG